MSLPSEFTDVLPAVLEAASEQQQQSSLRLVAKSFHAAMWHVLHSIRVEATDALSNPRRARKTIGNMTALQTLTLTGQPAHVAQLLNYGLSSIVDQPTAARLKRLEVHLDPSTEESLDSASPWTPSGTPPLVFHQLESILIKPRKTSSRNRSLDAALPIQAIMETMDTMPRLTHLSIRDVPGTYIANAPVMPNCSPCGPLKTLELYNAGQIFGLHALGLQSLTKFHSHFTDMTFDDSARCLPSITQFEMSENQTIEYIPSLPQATRCIVCTCDLLQSVQCLDMASPSYVRIADCGVLVDLSGLRRCLTTIILENVCVRAEFPCNFAHPGAVTVKLTHIRDLTLEVLSTCFHRAKSIMLMDGVHCDTQTWECPDVIKKGRIYVDGRGIMEV